MVFGNYSPVSVCRDLGSWEDYMVPGMNLDLHCFGHVSLLSDMSLQPLFFAFVNVPCL